MKFWQKMMIVTLLLFVIMLDASVVVILQKSWSQNLEREISRAQNEQTMLQRTLTTNLNGIASRGADITDIMLRDMVASYDRYYEAQQIRLFVWQEDTLLYPQDGEMRFSEGISLEYLDDRHYLMIGATFDMPYESFSICYQRDIEFLYDSQREVNSLFVMVNVISCVLLAIVLYFLIAGLTRPLKTLSRVSAQIAQGDYEKRIEICSKDEFGEVAKNFNEMADAVEHHIHELGESANDKQRLVDNLAHELRTPLTAMSGFSQTLLSGKLSTEEQNKALNYISQETARLKDLSFKLLDMAVYRNEAIAFDCVMVDALFCRVLENTRAQCTSKGILLRVETTVPNILGDADLLASFFSNLIENAVHASQNGDTILLCAEQNANGALLFVQDWGYGMTQVQAEKALEPFYRADKSRSRKHGGAGLGLSLCKQIAEIHRALIKIESVPEKGTKVSIVLHVPNNFNDT